MPGTAGADGSQSNGTGNEGVSPTAKRRKTVSSRGVANLTAAQLARKRANDREAQRAIRKRTKEQIESLENRVKELTAQLARQDLARVLSERDAALAENEEIRKRLATVMAIVQPIMDASGMTEQQLSTAPPTVVHDASSSSNQLSLITPASAPYAAAAQATLGSTGTSAQQQAQSPTAYLTPHTGKPRTLPTQTQFQQSQQSQPLSSNPCAPLPPKYATPSNASIVLDSPFTSESSQTQSYATPSPACSITNLISPTWADLPPQQTWSIGELMDFKKKAMNQTLDFSGNGERLGFNFLINEGTCALPADAGVQQQTSPPNVPQRQQLLQPPRPRSREQRRPSCLNRLTVRQLTTSSGPSPRVEEFMQPKNVILNNLPPTCPMDGILLDFLSSRRRRAAEGASSRQLVGPPYPSVSSLLNSSVESYSHPISKVFTEILSTFPHLDALPDRVAVLYIMFLLMRWQIYPTKENYERLPDWLVPLPCQFSTQHPAWNDYLIFPRMRERVVMANAQYPFAAWFIPYTADLTVNWPYEPTDSLLATAGCDELLINPVFEQHLRKLENWSLGSRFTQAFPELADTANIKER
ncbi:hypothetical protein KEM52_003804 [Ascosphaera acerosa]|nr:hypothetical protein KEM52_003804 [Ascosphaera acerosa]